MDYHTFIERVKSGDIYIDTNGHNRSLNGSFEHSQKVLRKRIIDRIEWDYNYHKKKSEENISDIHHATIMWMLESDNAYTPDNIWSRLCEIDYECHACGERHLKLYLKDNDTISIRKWNCSGNIMNRESFKSWHTYEPCIFANGYKPMKTRINIPTGNLVFCNHFGEFPDAPEGMEYDTEYSLNNLLGRRNIAEHLAKSCIGYGQVSNCSISIYISEDGKSIRILDKVDYILDDATYYDTSDEIMPDDEKKEFDRACNLVKGYKRIGSLSLDVWRWMCADKMVINEERLDINNNNSCSDVVECEVKSGEWEISHYYDIIEDSLLVSEMKLV